jgi:hypothetical protein
MTEQKHTPGPWIARKTGGQGWPGQRGWAIDFNEDQEQVVDFVYEAADAKLIAAAPDMLEALIKLHDSLKQLNDCGDAGRLVADYVDIAQAAIAKATQ